ncbi:MAG: rhomboid family intramembrane serine protease [Lachnospiraceae bacterium]|uniref:rhomboid family intramembrane serine protease n=1 Tax=uncultured Acetatifactor sp. TaxID=1671927 RepID=UPI0026195621|nr:rhomboid family intramembrane serine protease [uncultured Acetatifactor sp.]MCI8787740.1 rhomboid family intramembrane serine protease [Lachnospiraceae bacterium]
MRSLKFQPIVSTMLVTVNAVVFVLCHFTDELYEAGVLDVYSVLAQKEYGRILWSMFLHSGLSHLFNNMMILFFLGSMIEKEVGHVFYAAAYFLSGIGGNILSLLSRALQGDPTASLGASGAVFGLDGVLLAMVLFSGREMENVTPARVLLMIAYSLYSGFTGQNIDNVAHVGGLLTGFLAASAICLFRRLRGRRGD